jgi:hypothetical protein
MLVSTYHAFINEMISVFVLTELVGKPDVLMCITSSFLAEHRLRVEMQIDKSMDWLLTG